MIDVRDDREVADTVWCHKSVVSGQLFS